MGLDMYLKASKYISGYKHSGDDKQSEYRSLASMFGISDHLPSDSPSASVEFTVAYWRKANAIHAWFVRAVQDDKDDCGSYEVSREQLEELRNLCVQVLAVAKTENGKVHNGTTWSKGIRTENYEDGIVVTNPEEVAAILPSRGGFFFGSTDYNQYYMDDMRDTISQIDRVLQIPEGWDFEYLASW